MSGYSPDIILALKRLKDFSLHITGGIYRIYPSDDLMNYTNQLIDKGLVKKVANYGNCIHFRFTEKGELLYSLTNL